MVETHNPKTQSGAKEKTTKYQLIIFVAAFSAFLATFNETFLNVSFSAVMEDFHVSVGTVQWLAAAYMLGAAIMVPVSAFAYKSIPTKKLYLFTVGLLIVGSVIGAVSSNFSVLLIGRIVQALGTGMLIPIGMNITLEVAPKEKLGTFMGIMGLRRLISALLPLRRSTSAEYRKTDPSKAGRFVGHFHQSGTDRYTLRYFYCFSR